MEVWKKALNERNAAFDKVYADDPIVKHVEALTNNEIALSLLVNILIKSLKIYENHII